MKNVFIYLICTLIFLGTHIFCLSQNTGKDFDILYDSIYSELHHQFFNNSDFSFSEKDYESIQLLYSLNEVNDNTVDKARVKYLDALLRYSNNSPDYDTILSIINDATNIITKDNYPNDYAKLILLKGMIYVDATSYYIEAYQYINEALSLLDKTEPEYIALAYNYLALLWTHLNEWENALEAIEKSETIFTEAGYEKTAFFVRSNSYSINLKIGNYEKVIPQIKKDLNWANSQKDTTSATFLNILLGNSYVQLNNLDSAEIYLNHALNLIAEYEHTYISRKSDLYYSLSRLYYLKNDYELSLYYSNIAIPHIKQSGSLAYEATVYQILSDIYVLRDQIDSAYLYLTKSITIKDSLSIQEKSNEIQRINSHAELLNYQQKLQITEQNAKIKQTRSLLIIIILIFALTLIFFIVVYLNREKRLKELKIKQLDNDLKNKEINSRLEKLELEKQVEEKEREMATSQLLITEKNKILESMLDTFKPFYTSKEISNKIWREINQFVSSNTRKENEWEKSKIHFEKVHPEFFKKLKEISPNLTENDLRLCAYIKIGMRSKEIAEMLSIDHRSVISNRYHLKKKLNLPKEQSVDDFIRNI